MKNRSVIKLLACLGQRNINSLDSYLHSFYGKQECVLLFDAVKECAPKFSNKKMQTELVWQRCFPSKKMSTNKLDKLCSALYSHVKEFMAWQEMKEDAITQEKLFLKAANRYGQRELFLEILNGLVSLIKNSKNTEIWINEALIEVYHHQYFSVNLMRKKDKGKQVFINTIENLDAFYLTYRTLLETEKRTREYVLNEELPEFKFEALRHLLKTTRNKCQTSLLFQTLEAFLEKEITSNPAFYDVVEEKVFKLISNLDISDQEIVLNFLTIAANYYTKKGKKEFVYKLFRIAKLGIESGTSLKNNSMSHMFFINVIGQACKVKEIDWAEAFCLNYKHFLDKEIQEETVEVANARIAFTKKDYPKAKKILENSKYYNLHNLRRRWILTMVYYESNDDKLIGECEAFTQFLYRDKLYNEMNKRATLSFLKAINMLRNPNLDKEKIVQFVESCNVISQRTWIDEKIKERKS